MKAGKRKWIKEGAKARIRSADTFSDGEIVEIKHDKYEGQLILMRIVEHYWVKPHEIEEIKD